MVATPTMVVLEVVAEQSAEVTLAEGDDVVEALTANAADDPIDEGVLPGTSTTIMGEAQRIPPWRRGPTLLDRPRAAHSLRDRGCFDSLGTDNRGIRLVAFEPLPWATSAAIARAIVAALDRHVPSL